MKAKQLILPVVLVAACFICGYGIGSIVKKMKSKEKAVYVEPAQVEITDGVMTPEVLLALGRLSDPQLSPDGSKILYGVSYQSIANNNSCRNLFVCNPDGSGKVQLTKEAKSISCARWSKDGKSIYFIQGGQLHKAPFKAGKLGNLRDVKNSHILDNIGRTGQETELPVLPA